MNSCSLAWEHPWEDHVASPFLLPSVITMDQCFEVIISSLSPVSEPVVVKEEMILGAAELVQTINTLNRFVPFFSSWCPFAHNIEGHALWWRHFIVGRMKDTGCCMNDEFELSWWWRSRGDSKCWKGNIYWYMRAGYNFIVEYDAVHVDITGRICLQLLAKRPTI